MGFSEKDTLKLKPVNATGWDGTLDPRLTAPAGVNDEEVHRTALTFARHARGNVKAGDGWNLLEACGLVPYKSGSTGKSKAEKSPVIKYPVRGQ